MNARLYDPIVGQFFSPDELAGQYPHLSPYSYCGNDPVNFTDMTGKFIDDYFNRQGRYLGSTPVGNNIMITSATSLDGVTIGNSELFSSFLGSSVSLFQKLATAGRIGSYYGEMMGIEGSVGFGFESSTSAVAFTTTITKRVFLNGNQFDYKVFDNISNVKSALFHEKLHQKDPNPSTFVSHAEIYLEQIQNNIFSGTTPNFQIGMITSFANYFMNGVGQREINSHDLIDKFNETNKRGYFLKYVGMQEPYGMELYQNGKKLRYINYQELRVPR